MRLRLTSLYGIVLLATSIWVASVDLRVAAAYAAAALALWLPLRVGRPNRGLFFVLLFTSAWIWITHLLRAPLIAAEPAIRKYGNVGYLSVEYLPAPLLEVGVAGFLLLVGIRLGSEWPGPGPDRHDDRTPIVVRFSVLVTLLMLSTVIGMAALQLGLGLQTKGAEDTERLGFLTRVLPSAFLYPLAVLYICRYRRKIGLPQVLIWILIFVVTLGLGISSGSRAFLLSLLIVGYVYLFAGEGDRRMRMSTTTIMAAGLLLTVIISFGLAVPIRNYVRASPIERAKVEDYVQLGRERLLTGQGLLLLLNQASGRLGGLDGYITTKISQPREVVEVFSWSRTLSRVVDKLVPLYQPVDGTSSGRTISRWYAATDVGAGAVGLFGAFRLMGGMQGVYVLSLMFGVFWGAFFRLLEFAPEDLRFILSVLGIQTLLSMVLAGNFDNDMSSFILRMMHLAFFGGVLLFLRDSLRPPRPLASQGAGGLTSRTRLRFRGAPGQFST